MAMRQMPPCQVQPACWGWLTAWDCAVIRRVDAEQKGFNRQCRQQGQGAELVAAQLAAAAAAMLKGGWLDSGQEERGAFFAEVAALSHGASPATRRTGIRVLEARGTPSRAHQHERSQTPNTAGTCKLHERHLVCECPAMRPVRDRHPALFSPAKSTMAVAPGGACTLAHSPLPLLQFTFSWTQ